MLFDYKILIIKGLIINFIHYKRVIKRKETRFFSIFFRYFVAQISWLGAMLIDSYTIFRKAL